MPIEIPMNIFRNLPQDRCCKKPKGRANRIMTIGISGLINFSHKAVSYLEDLWLLILR